jgi:hypothetical protein
MIQFAKESNQQLLNTILRKRNDGVFGLGQSNIISPYELLGLPLCTVLPFVRNAASVWRAEVGARGLVRGFAANVRDGSAGQVCLGL